jgi:hypothetical protein
VQGSGQRLYKIQSAQKYPVGIESVVAGQSDGIGTHQTLIVPSAVRGDGGTLTTFNSNSSSGGGGSSSLYYSVSSSPAILLCLEELIEYHLQFLRRLRQRQRQESIVLTIEDIM